MNPGGPSNSSAATSKPVTHRITRLPVDADGGDPLVRNYLERFRTSCAFYTLSWSMILFGVVFALVGGLIGNYLAGEPAAKPWSESRLVAILHANYGNPIGSLLGMAGGAAVLHGIGLVAALMSRKRVASAHEPWFGFILIGLLYLACYDLLVFASVVTGGLCVIYLSAIIFRLLALALGGHRGMRHDELPEPEGGWPLYTVLIPLYKERNVARNILTSLSKLDYPRDRLDVKFLLEADDPETLDALMAAGIPAWAEVVVVPQGQPKTKPRACNHGLARSRGTYVVIYDAEDRPAADQLKQAVLAFEDAAPNVLCLQAQLAYHNHRQNLLTRWFALEYNVWFGRYLSGLERLGVPIPLGGTSNHFHRKELLALGGWDPFNVTEDCDLGVRLHLGGYVTRMLDSTTWEEANSKVGNWIRQRSRWLKGYMITWLVWGRRPLRLVGTLGPWSTLGFFLSVFCVAALAAINLVLWLVSGIYAVLLAIDVSRGHALWELLTTRDMRHDRLSWPMVYSGIGEDAFWSSLSQLFFAVSVCLILGNLAFVLINAWAGRRPGQRGLLIAALVSPFYWILISIAAWKGVWQLLFKPHYWEKTVHGLDEVS